MRPDNAIPGNAEDKSLEAPEETFPLRYVSTRGRSAEAGFGDVLLTGLAPDGGLYVPTEWPRVTEDEIAGFAGRPYHEVAADIIGHFTSGEVDQAALLTMSEDAYRGFNHPAVTPLIQLDNGSWLLELFHGPTFAFKDLAMQLLSRLMDYVLTERGQRATIVVATSGDTGGSAIEAFRGAEKIDLFVLFPDDRVSDVQRRQMTTIADDNVHAVAIDGSFDDCQALVKGLFASTRFRDRVSLAAVNSINWARIVAQTAYYFVAGAALGSPARTCSFCVPTGNFGDVFAGYVAGRMGLPIERLTIATNANDILARALETGRYEVTPVMPTSSPSMDIQVSSNFERLLWEAFERDSDRVVACMDRLKQSGAFDIDDEALGIIRQSFDAGSASEAQTSLALAATLRNTNYLADPHTGVALSVAARAKRSSAPMITLATAHPAKFPDAVEAATGQTPPLPDAIASLFDKTEKAASLANDQGSLEAFINERARASRLEA